MNIAKHYFPVGVFSLIILCIVLSSISCQYDYRSPLPGTIEIRLKTISNTIGFSDFTNFVVKVTSIYAIRADQGKLIIYEDKKAIQSSTMIINILNFHARDGDLVIGQAYAPPGDYIGIGMIVNPGSEVILGTKIEETQPIPVVLPESYQSLWLSSKSFKVQESQKTNLTLILDLDKSMIKGAYDYSFNPQYEMTIGK